MLGFLPSRSLATSGLKILLKILEFFLTRIEIVPIYHLPLYANGAAGDIFLIQNHNRSGVSHRGNTVEAHTGRGLKSLKAYLKKNTPSIFSLYAKEPSDPACQRKCGREGWVGGWEDHTHF